MPDSSQRPSPAAAAKFQRQRKLSRALAVQFLYQMEVRGNWEPDWDSLPDFQALVVNATQEEQGSGFSDMTDDLNGAWSYSEKLIRGISECHEELDGMIAAAASNWSLNRMAAMDRAILRLGAYEITKVAKVTAAIAINEAVELAKMFGQPDSPRFINGVLDKVRRNQE